MGSKKRSRYDVEIRDDAVSWAATEEDTVVVLDLRTSKYLSLNPSGSLLWQRLANGATESDLQLQLMREFQLDPVRAAADVSEFLETLSGRDLLAEA